MTLDELLRTNHIRAYQLADAIGYTAQAISLWRVGKRVPTTCAKRAICRYFGVDESEVIWNP